MVMTPKQRGMMVRILPFALHNLAACINEALHRTWVVLTKLLTNDHPVTAAKAF